MKIFLYAVGIAMFFEGVPYLAFPEKAKQMMRMILEFSDSSLRIIGGVFVFIGFLLLYFV